MKTHISTPGQLIGGLYRLAKVAFQRLLLVSALCGLASTASGAQRQWTGAGGDNNFSNPNNWDPVGSPQNLDGLVFPAGADAYNDNDTQTLPTFAYVSFTGSGTARISGRQIHVHRIECLLTSGLAQIDMPVLGVGDFVFHVAGGGTLSMNAALIALGGLGAPPLEVQKHGPGTLILRGNIGGTVTILAGVLIPMSERVFVSLTHTSVVTVAGGTLQLVAAISNPLRLDGYGLGGTNGALMVPANSNVTLNASIELYGSAASINVAENASLAIGGEIRGTGSLTKIGSGDLYLGGASNNTYASSTIVNEGALHLSKYNHNVIAVPGSLIVEAASGSSAVARFNRSGMMNASATVTINANSLLDLNGNNQTLNRLNLNDGGAVQTGAGTLGFRAGAVVSVGTLNPPEVGLRLSSSISGRMALPVLDYLTFDVAPYARGHFPGQSELEIPAVIGEAGNIVKIGGGALRLRGANTFNDSPPNFSGDVFVNGGSLIAAHPNALGGTAGWTFVNNDALLILAGDISVNGETLHLNTDNSPALDNVGNNIWNGPINLTRDSIIGVGQNQWLQALGVIGGAGSLTKIGPGTVTLGGPAHNTFAGDTFVNEGTLELAKSAYLQTVPGNLIIGLPGGGPEAAALYWSHDQVWQNIIVNDNGLLDLNGFDEYASSLTLNGGGDVQTAIGSLIGSLYVLNGGITVNPGSNTTSTIAGKLGFDSGKHTIHVGSGSTVPGVHELVVFASIFEANPTVSLEKTGPGGVRFTGTNTHTGTNYVLAGKLQVDGFQPQSRVYVNGGTLLGMGTVGHVDFGGSGRIAPGASPGILTSSNFNAGALGSGTLAVELNGITAGSQYDQLNVRGSVRLTGLTLQASRTFTPAVGNTFTIINNDGADPVTGTFPGVPQGGTVNAGGALFTVSYTGGDGNDVVLTFQSLLPQISVTTLPVDVPNYALTFGGDNARVQVGSNAFPAVIDNFTIELWVNPTRTRQVTAEANAGISDIANQSYAVFPDHGWDSYDGQDHAGAGLSIGLNGISVVEHGFGYLPTLLVYSNAISGWTHVALVYVNRTPRLYVNGMLARAGSLASGKTNVHPSASLGGSIQGIDYGDYHGQLDEVRIWDTPLSPTQITNNMNRTLTGAEPGLVAYYRCDENGGTSIADSAPASPNNSGILTDGAAFVLSGAPLPYPIDGPTVTLKGLANAGGVGGTVWFEWGATTNYGNVTAVQAVVGGFNGSFSQQLTGLAAGSYHFRAVGSNSFNVSFGLDQSFTLLYGTPSLRIETLPGGQVRLLWPTNGPLFRLQFSANLNPAAWFAVLPPGTVVGTNRVVTNATSSTAQFYRLINP